jgi:hypothetical protein
MKNLQSEVIAKNLLKKIHLFHLHNHLSKQHKKQCKVRQLQHYSKNAIP